MPELKHNYFGSNRASKFIYGIILMFVFVISQSHGSESGTSPIVILAVLASISFTFAEIYSEIIGGRIKKKGSLPKEERSTIVQDSFAIVSIGSIVAIIFLLSGLGLYSLQMAFAVSYFVLLLLLFLYSYWAYRLSGYNSVKSAAIALLSASIGLIIVILKYTFSE